jgi:hypothetical protein
MRSMKNRLRKLEQKAGYRWGGVYLINWHPECKTEEEVLAKHLADNPGKKIPAEDTIVLLRTNVQHKIYSDEVSETEKKYYPKSNNNNRGK